MSRIRNTGFSDSSLRCQMITVCLHWVRALNEIFCFPVLSRYLGTECLLTSKYWISTEGPHLLKPGIGKIVFFCSSHQGLCELDSYLCEKNAPGFCECNVSEEAPCPPLPRPPRGITTKSPPGLPTAWFPAKTWVFIRGFTQGCAPDPDPPAAS